MLTSSPHGRPDFLQELLEIRNDPKVKSLARRRAGDADLAEDALQEAYCAVARVADPAAIRDLRAYFCQTLIRKVYHLLGQLGAASVNDLASLADARQERSSIHPSALRPVDETVITNLLDEARLRSFAASRRKLADAVPSRSADPDRYANVTVAVAEWVLRAGTTEVMRDFDLNAALTIAYPEWFQERGCAENTRHQRFRRAREDIRALLRTIINREDLKP